MSSSKSWFAIKAKAAHSRYGLSRNIQILLQSLDDYYKGSIDATELGRLVRLSPKRRSAIANTIAKCAEIIKKQPSEIKTCVDIIEMCTEVLEIADAPPPIQAFPLMKLPLEIRDRILDLIIGTVFKCDNIAPAHKETTCGCPFYLPRGSFRHQTVQMKALPTLLSTALHDEFCRIFFRDKTFRFGCSCELVVHVARNTILRENVRKIHVHWCGRDSAKAFSLLTKCPRLEILTLAISKSTYTHLNERAESLRYFFPVSHRHVRLADVLGLDELLTIRGLKDVRVQHFHFSMTAEQDRAGLRNLLSGKLTLERHEEEAEV
ncbi:hypothetical protein HIM_01788 [Hirsutella minnesotensis 3608]|nr:hypothetical protein HIM_01788 [Hirsutella minnesotensis 3608]